MREGAVSKVLLLPERQAVPLPDRGYREETHAVSDSAPSIAGLKPENLASFFYLYSLPCAVVKSELPGKPSIKSK